MLKVGISTIEYFDLIKAHRDWCELIFYMTILCFMPKLEEPLRYFAFVMAELTEIRYIIIRSDNNKNW